MDHEDSNDYAQTFNIKELQESTDSSDMYMQYCFSLNPLTKRDELSFLRVFALPNAAKVTRYSWMPNQAQSLE